MDKYDNDYPASNIASVANIIPSTIPGDYPELNVTPGKQLEYQTVATVHFTSGNRT